MVTVTSARRVGRRAQHARDRLADQGSPLHALMAVAAAVALAACLDGCAATRDRSSVPTATASPQSASARISASRETRSARSVAADEAAIADFNRRYLGAINDGDIATLSSLTTEGHIMLAPGRPPIVGKAANDAANGRVAQQFKIDEHWTPIETVIDGDLAYQRGTFTVAATPKAGGETRNTSGNFLRIYRRQTDGSWRMVRDMFNSDKPAAPN
jgi:ketosteroid isomerase-like protein